MLFKVLIAAIFVASLSSVAITAPLSPTTIELLINDVIPRGVKNATQEMKNLYQLITSSNYIESSLVMLPNMNTQVCYSGQQAKDKLTIAYKKLFIFKNPLYMAYSYEESCGPQHQLLAQALRYTSNYVNGSTNVLHRMLRDNHFPVPTVQTGMSEADLNRYCRGYLQALVKRNLVKLVITDDVVRIFRNYLILSSLSDSVAQVSNCVTGI